MTASVVRFRLNDRGFTLVELLIAVAVIGIVAAFALPAYSDYMSRGRISEGLVLAAGAKLAVADAPRTMADVQAAADDYNVNPARSKYVRQVAINNATGVITVTLNEGNVGGLTAVTNTITLSPFVFAGGVAATLADAYAANTAGSVVWACASESAGVAVQRGMTPAMLGRVPARLAPADCR